MERHRFRALLLVAATFLVAENSAQAQQTERPLWASNWEDAELRAGLETYTAFYAMRGTWWNLTATSAPTFDKNRSFTELWVHPRL
ncbi:MAG: hypothetical protein ACK52M_04230, partial [bacterium]